MAEQNIIVVQTISGQILRFVADRPEAIVAQLRAMNPEAFFQRRQLYFNHASMLVGVPCDKIAFVRFEFPVDPGWTFPFGASRIEILGREQFDSQVVVKRVQAKVLLQNAVLGTDILIFQRITLLDGTRIHFRVSLKTVPAAIRVQNVENATALNSYFAFTENGFLIINRAAVAFWHGFPGPLMAPPNAISITEQLPDEKVEQ